MAKECGSSSVIVGVVKVKVVRGTNLAVRDVFSSDPYVVLKLGNQEVYDRDTFVDDPMGAAFFELRPLVEAAAASSRRRTPSGVDSKEDGTAVVPRSGSSVVWSASEGKAAQGLVLRLAGVESGEVELQLELEWHGGAAGDTSMIDRLIDRNS
ncbi:hypothetical protein OsI_25900 [Oryza sativa Indica Group]|uniref:C2 domain-containing protein n=3 Tax=Oryza TaxID=4527 RepID=A0A0E0Q7V4_ORYRU|nr:hypothetical protein OsI_25900 [Oryza sativa Indica Group]